MGEQPGAAPGAGEASEEVDYEAQLQQVQELLRIDPGNAELVQLQDSLVEVIRLTKQVGVVGGEQEDSGAAAKAVAWSPDSMCEAFFSKSWFPAIVKSCDGVGGAVTVEFLGYGNVEAIDPGMVRVLSGERTIEPALCVKGFQCRAKYAADEQWYDAVVEAPTARGFRVKFTEYGNLEEVPLEWLALRPAADNGEERQSSSAQTTTQATNAPPSHGTAGGAAAAASSKQTAVAAPSGAFVVPEHLKVLPTDTEEQKLKKRKKVKALKLANKGREDEEARRNKQQSWQQFQKKAGSKKRTKGFMGTAVNKGSMFASPDSVDGKVGVTGSGQGTTEFNIRKKYKLG